MRNESTQDPGGRPAVRLQADGTGDDVVIAATGAQVLRWHRRGRDVLWTASAPAFDPGKPVRGGVPIVFPWFGDHRSDPDLPAHGFVRNRDWQREPLDPDSAAATFTLTDDVESRAMWPFAFAATFRVVLDPEAGLHLTFAVENRSAERMPCEVALHTYYAVGDIHTASVDGLQGVRFVEHAREPEGDWDHDAPLRFRAETDRVFQDVPDQLVIDAPALSRRLTLTTTNARSAIVWNPWPNKTARLSQMAPDDWQRFACVESANVHDNALELAPGERHELTLAIRCDEV